VRIETASMHRLQAMFQQGDDVLAGHIAIEVDKLIGHLLKVAEQDEEEHFKRLRVLKNNRAVGLVFLNVLGIVYGIFAPMRLRALVVLHMKIFVVDIVLSFQKGDAVLVDVLGLWKGLSKRATCS
jgi:hypothetical protein